MTDRPLWTVDAMAAAMRAARAGSAAAVGRRASRSTAARIAPGEAFFAIKGDSRDGHDFVAAALAGRRRRSRSSPPTSATRLPADAPLLVVPDVLDGAARSRARGARALARRRSSRVTGSVGKTGTKEALRLALAAQRRDPCLGRLLQQSLGRAAVARALSRERALRACSRSA